MTHEFAARPTSRRRWRRSATRRAAPSRSSSSPDRGRGRTMTWSVRLRPATRSSSPTALTALLGGKGANLAVMANELGLPVPPGFVITHGGLQGLRARRLAAPVWTTSCGRRWPASASRSGGRFGDPRDPLLVSVRSGAPVSMPGHARHHPQPRPERRPRPRAWPTPPATPAFAAACRARLESMYRDIVGARPCPGRPLAAAARAPSRPSSAPGTATGRAPIANGRASRPTSARPSSCRPWSSAIAGRLGHGRALHAQPGHGRERALRRRALRRPGRGRRGRHARHRAHLGARRAAAGRRRASCARTPRAWSATSATSATSSSPSRRGASGCSRTASASAPRRRPAGSPWRWPRTTTSRCRGRRPSSACRRHPGRPAPGDRSSARARPRSSPPAWEPRPGLASGAIATPPEAAVRMADAGAAVLARALGDLARTTSMAWPRSVGILTSTGGLASHAAVVARGWDIPAVVGAAGRRRERRPGDHRRDRLPRGRRAQHRRQQRRGLRGRGRGVRDDRARRRPSCWPGRTSWASRSAGERSTRP